MPLRGEKNLRPLLERVELGRATLGDYVADLLKLAMCPPAFPLLGIHPREMSAYAHQENGPETRCTGDTA